MTDDRAEQSPADPTAGASGGPSVGPGKAASTAPAPERRVPHRLLFGALIAAVLVLLVALVWVAFGGRGNRVTDPPPASQPATPLTAAPTGETAPTAAPTTTAAAVLTPLKAADVTVDCAVSPAPQLGSAVTMTYTLTATRPGTVGLGAGVVDENVNDHGVDDSGDRNSYALHAGIQQYTRTLRLPAKLPKGSYDISAEVWPTGQVGKDGVETLTDETCATLTVP